MSNDTTLPYALPNGETLSDGDEFVYKNGTQTYVVETVIHPDDAPEPIVKCRTSTSGPQAAFACGPGQQTWQIDTFAELLATDELTRREA